jgi:hypothetical protein
MALGLPTFVSPTFSYTKILTAMNLERILIVVDKIDLNKIKSKAIREEISVKFYNYVWKFHNPSMIAQKMYEVFKAYAR